MSSSHCLTSLGGPDLVRSPESVMTEMSSGMALEEKLNTCRIRGVLSKQDAHLKWPLPIGNTSTVADFQGHFQH